MSEFRTSAIAESCGVSAASEGRMWRFAGARGRTFIAANRVASRQSPDSQLLTQQKQLQSRKHENTNENTNSYWGYGRSCFRYFRAFVIMGGEGRVYAETGSCKYTG